MVARGGDEEECDGVFEWLDLWAKRVVGLMRDKEIESKGKC